MTITKNENLKHQMIESAVQEAHIKGDDSVNLESLSVAKQNALNVFEESQLKASICSGQLAQAQAQSTVQFLRSARQLGRLDLSKPIYIIELGANDGAAAHQFLISLQRILSEREWQELSIRYLLGDHRQDRISACWQHPCLRPWIEAGIVEPLVFDPRTQSYIEFQSQPLVLSARSINNPAIVLANSYFSNFAPEFYYIQYGRLYQADVQSKSDQNRFDFKWQLLGGDDRDSNSIKANLLKGYVHRFDELYLSLPMQTLSAIDSVFSITDNDCLLLGSDRGYVQEHQMRSMTIPEISNLGRFFLPLNGDALRRYANSNSWAFDSTQIDYEEPLNFALLKSKGGYDLNDMQAKALPAYRAHSNSQHLLALFSQTEGEITNKQSLALSSQVGSNNRVLLHMLPERLNNEIDNLPLREQWRTFLNRLWDGDYHFDEMQAVYERLAYLAMDLDDWGLAIKVFKLLQTINSQNTGTLFNLAHCHLKLGHLLSAKRYIAQALVLEPSDQELTDFAAYLYGYQQQCDSNQLYSRYLLKDKSLSLHPLGMHHCQDFLAQYRDPTIAVMTSLPEITNEQEYASWLEEQHQKPHKKIYAITDRDCGFVGVISMSQRAELGFFYFWIGVDYQSRGFGQRAATLLFAAMKRHAGIKQIYTCVFKDNSRSLAALKSLGLAPLSLKAKEPNHEYLFFCDQGINQNQTQTLDQYFRETQSPIELII